MRRNSCFWWLVAVAVGLGGAWVPERLSAGSTAMTFVLMLVYTLAGAVLISHINPTGVWRWAVAIIGGTLLAQVFLAIPESEPLTRALVADALIQQKESLAAYLTQTFASALGCGLGAAMSGGK